MSEEMQQPVDASSAEFKKGVDAGLNAKEQTKNWKAGNELGEELKVGDETKEPVRKDVSSESSKLRSTDNTSEGNKGNLQDEKDETEE